MRGFERYGIESGKLLQPDHIPDFNEIAEYLPNENLPLLLQRNVDLKNLSPDQQFFYENGFIVKRRFIPEELVDRYIALRESLNLGRARFPDVWSHLDYRVIRDIFCSPEMNALLNELMGEALGLHLVLSQFQSLERGWHQDDYLNPEDLFGRYVGVWTAMGDVDPDSGPFQCVPGSHRWPVLRRQLVQELVVQEARDNVSMEWCLVAEHHVNKAVDRLIEDIGADIYTFDARKGDVLIWSGTLMHRGALARNPELARPSLIGHLSSISRRTDFGRHITRNDVDGGYFWEFPMHGRSLSEIDSHHMFERQRAAA